MDLQTATRLCGRRWQLARIGTLLCFALACGLLVSSLVSTSRAGLEQQPMVRRSAI